MEEINHKYIYHWRIKNRDKYNELSRKHSLNYYYKNKDKILEKQRLKYHQSKLF